MEKVTPPQPSHLVTSHQKLSDRRSAAELEQKYTPCDEGTFDKIISYLSDMACGNDTPVADIRGTAMDALVGEKGHPVNIEGDMNTRTPNPEIVQPSEKQDQESANKPTAQSISPQPSQLAPAQETIDTSDAITHSNPEVSVVPAAPSTSSAPSSTIVENSLLDSPLMGKVKHLPLNIVRLAISNAKFGPNFVKVLIERVVESKKLKELTLGRISCGDADEGEEFGVRLAEAIATNNTIKKFSLNNTDLLATNNVKRWGEAFMNNNTLTWLFLHGVADDIKSEIRRVTKERTPKLYID